MPSANASTNRRTSTCTTDPAARQSSFRVLFGAGVGNALEWYDWSIYATFAPFFAKRFFDSSNSVSAILSTLAIFAVGFMMRPLGGIFFGWFADRHGRQRGMVLSMAITASGSLIIAGAPTHAAVGPLAPLLLLVARLAQGFGLGGEIGASRTFLAEASPRRRRGLWSSSMYIAVTCGVLLSTLQAAGLKTILDDQQMDDWGWRIPFALGAILGFYAFYLRRGLAESEAFREERIAADRHDRHVLADIWEHRTAVFRVVGLTVGGTVLYYTWAVGASTYAITVKHIDATSALWASVIGSLVYIAALPMWGALSDRWGRKPNVIIFCVGLGVLSFPLNWMVRDSAWQLGLAIAIALFLHAALTSILPVVMAEMFPTRVRASGMAFPYSVAVAATGGTAPYLQTYLFHLGMPSLFIIYSIALLAVSLVVAALMPETKAIRLT